MTAELRQYRRYPLASRAQFQWQSGDGKTEQGLGYTRDISKQGLFVITRTNLEVETYVQLEIALPVVQPGHPGSHLLACGYVVRSEREGFAALAHVDIECEDISQERERQLLGS